MVLVRHGATEWSASGKHTGNVDIELTAEGRAQADRLAPALAHRRFAMVLTSSRSRSIETAQRAGFGEEATVEPNLAEWDYGDYEGLTTPQIRASVPGWTVWTHPSPGGETAEQVGARADAVLARCRQAGGDVLLVSHGHLLRVLAARWLRLDPIDGRLFRLDPATVSELGHERDTATIDHWNSPAG